MFKEASLSAQLVKDHSLRTCGAMVYANSFESVSITAGFL